MPPLLTDLDAANFAAALSSFAPSAQAPHWPGYPVYVLAAKLFAALGANDVAALALPGVVGFVVAAYLLYRGIASRFGDRAALLVSVVFAFFPGAVTVGAAPKSDGLGLAMLAAAIGVALLPSVRARAGAAAIAGLGLGVRLSWWPLFLGVALLAAARDDDEPVDLAPLGAFALGNALWFVGLVVAVGGLPIGDIVAFGQGHVGTWGVPDVSRFERAIAIAKGAVETAGLPIIALAFAALFAMRSTDTSKPKRGIAWVAGTLVAYGAWVLLAQNVNNPRHLVPLVLGLTMVAAVVADLPRWAPIAAAVALLFTAAPRAYDAGTQPAPAAAVALEIGERVAEGPVQVFAGREGRLYERLIPGVRVWRPADELVLAHEAERASRFARVLVTSGAIGADTLPELVPIATHGDLTLFEYRPEKLHALAY